MPLVMIVIKIMIAKNKAFVSLERANVTIDRIIKSHINKLKGSEIC